MFGSGSDELSDNSKSAFAFCVAFNVPEFACSFVDSRFRVTVSGARLESRTIVAKKARAKIAAQTPQREGRTYEHEDPAWLLRACQKCIGCLLSIGIWCLLALQDEVGLPAWLAKRVLPPEEKKVSHRVEPNDVSFETIKQNRVEVAKIASHKNRKLHHQWLKEHVVYQTRKKNGSGCDEAEKSKWFTADLSMSKVTLDTVTNAATTRKRLSMAIPIAIAQRPMTRRIS